MNTVSSLDMNSELLSSMPNHPKERGEWCLENFGSLISMHIRHLKRFKLLPDKDQWLSFIGVFGDEYTKVQYGKLIIEFPYNIAKLKQSDWLAEFDIIIDGQPVVLDTGISSVPTVQTNTSTRTSRVVDKLLPARHAVVNMPVPNRIIRIQLKK